MLLRGWRSCLALLLVVASALAAAVVSLRSFSADAGQADSAARPPGYAGAANPAMGRAEANDGTRTGGAGSGAGPGTAARAFAPVPTDVGHMPGSSATAAVLAASPSPLLPNALVPAKANIPDLRLPHPGQYTLDRIMPVPHGAVLDSDGRARRMADYTTGKVTLLAFVYTTCSDSRGCPLAMTVMHSLKTAIESEPALARQLRFVSLSFDPGYDTPEVMLSYGGKAAAPEAPLRWHFLTTQSQRQLAPLLAGFGQDASPAGSSMGAGGGTGGRAAMAHLLKLYLIDQHGIVREIYSPAFLQADTMLTDMRSLVAEQGRGVVSAGARRVMR